MKNVLLLGLSLVFLASCDKSEITSPTGTIVKGKLEGITGNERILLQELQARSIVTVDTIIPDAEGNFAIGPNVPNYGFYRVFLDNKNFVNLILSPKDTVELYAQVADMEGTYSVAGSEETKLLKSFNDLMNVYVDKMDSINQVMQNAQTQQNIEMYQRGYAAQMELNGKTGDQVRQFVRENTTMLASLSAVQKLDPEGDFELLEKVAEGLKPKLGEQQLYTDFVARLDQLKKLMPGATLQDIALNDPKGIKTTLFAGLGDEVTLIDFWASWCKPCRQENPNIVDAYAKYRGKGFQVIGVSLDKDGEKWNEAIYNDKLTWPHLSDLKAWQSAVCVEYNISSIPANFLVDKNGKILAKNLRGPALHEKLKELLGS